MNRHALIKIKSLIAAPYHFHHLSIRIYNVIDVKIIFLTELV
jgi:hypothetical protein